MPHKKKPCPTCSRLMSPKASQCRACKPSYQRTPESRKKLSASLAGKPKTWLRGRKRPDHSAMMKEWWNDQRKDKKRQEMLARNPSARYHGLSAKAAARLVRDAGCCARCGHDGSESRLGVHHRNRDKRDQRTENLEVLCHRCHMRDHADAGETGWDRYWQRRKTCPDSATASRHHAAPAEPLGTPPPSSPRTHPASAPGRFAPPPHNRGAPSMEAR